MTHTTDFGAPLNLARIVFMSRYRPHRVKPCVSLKIMVLTVMKVAEKPPNVVVFWRENFGQRLEMMPAGILTR